jgi:hypothetical protein
MVLAAHYRAVHRFVRGCDGETVRFSRRERIDFRLLRGPDPFVVESLPSG